MRRANDAIYENQLNSEKWIYVHLYSANTRNIKYIYEKINRQTYEESTNYNTFR